MLVHKPETLFTSVYFPDSGGFQVLPKYNYKANIIPLNGSSTGSLAVERAELC